MPPQQAPVSVPPAHHYSKGLWFVGAVIAILAVGILVGVQLAHSNSDYSCTRSFGDTQQGACSNGSWGGWTSVNGVQQRTYTGTRASVTYAGTQVVSCSHPAANINGSSGTITTAYAACQIVQTGTGGNNGNGNGNGNGTSTSTITVTGQTETTGDVSTSSQVTISGSYATYLNALDALLATSSIAAVPSLVHAGATTKIVWTSGHVKACTVSGSNGDTWPKSVTSTQTVTDADGNQHDEQVTTMPAALSGTETTLPINGQTTYTLVCTTALGTKLTSTAIVNLIPVFNEQ